jgi:hypothetical protein
MKKMEHLFPDNAKVPVIPLYMKRKLTYLILLFALLTLTGCEEIGEMEEITDATDEYLEPFLGKCIPLFFYPLQCLPVIHFYKIYSR